MRIPLKKVNGTVFNTTFDELMQADSYEIPAYNRLKVKLDPGQYVWAYVKAEKS